MKHIVSVGGSYMNTAKQYCHSGYECNLWEDYNHNILLVITMILFKPVMELAEGGGRFQVNNIGKRYLILICMHRHSLLPADNTHSYGVCLVKQTDVCCCYCNNI